MEFHAVQTEAVLGGIAVHQLSYGAAVEVEPAPLGNWVLVSTPLRGAMTIRSGRLERTLAVGDSVAIDSYRAFSLSWENGCLLQTIRLPRRLVDEAGEAEIHRIVRDLAHREGLTVIVVSSEEEEICEVADDIAVIVHDRSTGRLIDAAETNLRGAAWAAA